MLFSNSFYQIQVLWFMIEDYILMYSHINVEESICLGILMPGWIVRSGTTHTPICGKK